MARKEETGPGDVVLVHLEERPASFARIEAVREHERRGWFYCDLLVLGVPLQPVTWILERAQIDGTPFTMGGQPVRLERLPAVGSLHTPAAAPESSEDPAANPAPVSTGEGVTAPRTPASRPRKRPREAAGPGNVVRLFPRDE